MENNIKQIHSDLIDVLRHYREVAIAEGESQAKRMPVTMRAAHRKIVAEVTAGRCRAISAAIDLMSSKGSRR